MTQYRLARPAKADLTEVWIRIAEASSPDTADRFVDSITESFPVLARMPNIGKVRNEIEEGLRSFPVGEYLVYYRRRSRWNCNIACYTRTSGPISSLEIPAKGLLDLTLA